MRYIASIGKQSASVFNILENLLAWANSQQNNIVFQPKHQRINFAVQNNIDLLSQIAVKKKITVNNEVKDSISANFDLILISTVVRNLIANAIKFTTSNGKITIKAEESESHITLYITDTGVGIKPERIEKLFDKAFFETTYGTNSEKGSGLGLKICIDFIERHNGKIWVESEIDKGSSFIFTLPKI